MNRIAFSVLTLAVFFTGGTYSQSPVVEAIKVWSSPDLLTTSESVLYHEAEQVLFVSCINGKPLEKNKSGYISKLSLAGDIMVLEWATGLNAPKGMGIHDGSLYVTDIDRVVKISLETGETEKEFPIPGSVFLNDIDVSETGVVYVSDMSTNKIHFIENDNADLWYESEQLSFTNGLFSEKDRLMVGTANGIFSVTYKDKKLEHVIKDTGGIDGLKTDGYGNYIISDWAGKVQLVNPGKEHQVLFNTTDEGINAADIEYIIDLKLLLVPTFHNNRVVAYDLIRKKK
jgi:sugar lactone lactonase YvrE